MEQHYLLLLWVTCVQKNAFLRWSGTGNKAYGLAREAGSSVLVGRARSDYWLMNWNRTPRLRRVALQMEVESMAQDLGRLSLSQWYELLFPERTERRGLLT